MYDDILMLIEECDKEFVIEVSGELTLYSGTDIAKRLRMMRYKIIDDPSITDSVYIIITSNGGNVCSSLEIMYEMDRLKQMDIKVYTLGYTLCGSCAAMIAMNGSIGCRYMTPNATIVIHQIRIPSENIGSILSIKVLEDSLKQLRDIWEPYRYEVLTSFNLSDSDLNLIDMGFDLNLNCREAIDKGVMDYIAK